MPRSKQPPRLWLRPARKGRNGTKARPVWIILDGGKHIATGCFAGEDKKAHELLAAYIVEKYSPERRLRDIESIDVADVLAVYDEDCRERQANKAKFDERLVRLVQWWGGKMLSEVTGSNCRGYTKFRGNNGGSRRDLEDLRAAINHHAKEGFWCETGAVANSGVTLFHAASSSRTEACRAPVWSLSHDGLGREIF